MKRLKFDGRRLHSSYFRYLRRIVCIEYTRAAQTAEGDYLWLEDLYQQF